MTPSTPRIGPSEERVLVHVAEARRGWRERGREVPLLRRLAELGLIARSEQDPERWHLTPAGSAWWAAHIEARTAAVLAAAEDERERGIERPTIIVNTEAERVVQESALALASRPDVFQRGRQLVRVLEDPGRKLRGLVRQVGAPVIQSVPLSQLRLWLASCADYRKVRFDQFGQVRESETGAPLLTPTLPPDWAVQGVLQLGRWPDAIRELQAVVETPMLRFDGTVLQQPGYDGDTGLLYLQPPELAGHEIPDHPSRADVEEARDLLLDVFADFPFRSEVHRAAAVAGLLTYFARFALPEALCPLFLVDANVRGGGKGLLVQVIAHICQGRDMALTSQSVDEQAEKMLITSIAMSGELLVQIDNITRPLGSSALDAALTTTVWSDRPLYTNELPRLPLLAMWWATGNNVQVKEGADTARRILHIRLESPHERPEQRDDFRHPDLLGYVRSARPQLVQAVLTILRGYCAAGEPGMGLPNWGRFERWSRLIRNCVVWCGLPDPFEAHEELIESADSDLQLVEDLIFGWEEVLEYNRQTGITCTEVKAQIEEQIELRRHSPQHVMHFERLYQALLQLTHSRDGRLPNANVIGNRLKRYRGRRVKGRRLDIIEKSKLGAVWTVRDK